MQMHVYGSWDSSVRIESDYRLTIWVRSPVEEKDFSLASVSRAALRSTKHPNQWVGVKRDRGVTLTTYPI
jgi:hypothetical protein